MPRLAITLIPLLSDNYAYRIEDPETGFVVVVDPAEADPVAAAIDGTSGRLDVILATHHHNDHIGGIPELKARYGATVIGPAVDAARIPRLDRGVGQDDSVPLGSVVARVIETPGHTSGHIAFYIEAGKALFCGDTLFALGCGRVFEGTPAEMWESLLRLRALPDTTRIYCGHEYTESNARFARAIDPANPVLEAYAEDIASMRRAGAPTIPAQLGREKLTNPFLRCDVPAFQEAVGMKGAAPAEVFAAVRRRKDEFRG